MKIICIDSTDPEDVTETEIDKGFTEEFKACARRDELRAAFEGKSALLWFEVVSDDYVLKAAPK